jgi:hypothetical protein
MLMTKAIQIVCTERILWSIGISALFESLVCIFMVSSLRFLGKAGNIPAAFDILEEAQAVEESTRATTRQL